MPFALLVDVCQWQKACGFSGSIRGNSSSSGSDSDSHDFDSIERYGEINVAAILLCTMVELRRMPKNSS